MKYIRGFLMAWGCFCRIPCPYRKWDPNGRYAMLNMFPFTGLLIGVIVLIAWTLLSSFAVNGLLTGVLLTVLYFWLTGFIHLDGFMDCSDAVLSRRPAEEKQRILKDSHVGAFAVISLAFMLMIFAASMTAAAEVFSLERAVLLCLIFMISREIAGFNVINKKSMKTSQYDDLSSHSSKERGLPGAVAVTVAAVLLTAGVCALGADAFKVIVLYACTLLIEAGVTSYTGRRMRKELGGMSGDISGCMVVTGEMTGVMVMALITASGFIY